MTLESLLEEFFTADQDRAGQQDEEFGSDVDVLQMPILGFASCCTYNYAGYG